MPKDSSQYIILLIDDDQSILKLLSDFISDKGYRVDTARHGGEALEKLSSHIYDLVIIDLNLPDMGGIDIVKWINQHSPETISIILSGYATIESTLEAISLGAFDYLIKPVQLAKLNIVLTNGLEQRKMIRQNKKLISDLQIAKKNLEARVRQRTKELRKSQERFRSLYDNAPDVYYTVDTGGMIIDCNKMASEFFGYSKHKLIGKHLLELISSLVPTVDGQGGKIRHQEVQVKRADGRVADVELNTNLLRDESGKVIGALTLQRDITARKRADEALRESEERYRTIFQSAEVSLWEIDYTALKSAIAELKESGIEDLRAYLEKKPDIAHKMADMIKIVDVNDATVKMFDAQTKEELLGSFTEILVPETMPVFCEYLMALAEGANVFESEAILRTLKGDVIYGLLYVAIPPGEAKFQNLLLSMVNITTRKEAEEEKDSLFNKLHELNKKLESLAITDGLTQLYNHRFFMESLSREFGRARRGSGALACLMADIDDFKKFNDNYGHQKGDEILFRVASILQGSRRGSDVVARYGGEEFVLLLPDTGLDQAVKLAKKLRKKVEQTSIKSEKNEKLNVTISIGAFAYTDNNIKDYRELLNKVDQALYLAKEKGKNRVCTLEDKGTAST